MTNRVGLLYDDLVLVRRQRIDRIVDGKVVVELKAGVLLPPYSERQPCLSQGDTTRGWIAAPLRARA
jgi:hypothetical protein